MAISLREYIGLASQPTTTVHNFTGILEDVLRTNFSIDPPIVEAIDVNSEYRGETLLEIGFRFSREVGRLMHYTSEYSTTIGTPRYRVRIVVPVSYLGDSMEEVMIRQVMRELRGRLPDLASRYMEGTITFRAAIEEMERMERDMALSTDTSTGTISPFELPTTRSADMTGVSGTNTSESVNLSNGYVDSVIKALCDRMRVETELRISGSGYELESVTRVVFELSNGEELTAEHIGDSIDIGDLINE